MELVLNFLWLMLALPAFAIWRQHVVSSHGTAKPHHSRSLLLLGCLLVLLFPAVSASDDLHPISAEVGESGPFKRTIKQSPGAKSSSCAHFGGGPALPAQTASFRPETVTLGTAPGYVPVVAPQLRVSPTDNRGPPQA